MTEVITVVIEDPVPPIEVEVLPAVLIEGTITSVNGKTGVVVLNASDVGADASGAAAAAQSAAIAAAATDATTKANAAQSAATSAAATDATTKANAAQAYAIQRANHTGTQSADTITDGTTNKAYTATEKTKLSGIATGATANATDAQLRDRSTHTGTQSADTLTDGTTNKAFLATERTKLSGIATGATANSSDATLLARANHTGTQTLSTISDAGTAASKNVAASGNASSTQVVKGDDTRLTDARPSGIHYKWVGSTTDTSTNPGTGKVLYGDDGLLAVNFTDADGHDLSGFLDGFTGSPGTPFGSITIRGASGGVWVGAVNGYLDTGSTWAQVHMDVVSDADAPLSEFANNEDVYIQFAVGVPTLPTPADIGALRAADNLSDLANAATARTNLGLGTAATSEADDFQPESGILDAVAAQYASVGPTANTIDYWTSGTARAAATLTAFARTLLDDADAATALTTLGAQPVDSDLTAIAALTTTSYGRALLTLANQAALTAALASGTESLPGILEIATQTETNTGTDDVRAVTPLKLQTRLAAYAQPLDSDLTAIAALSTTTIGRSLLAAADAAALRTILALGTIATAAAPSGTIVGTTDTQTLTNKRITKRVDAVTSTATYTFDADSFDAVKITAQAAGLTLANPSGTPTAMQPMVFRIKDNGTARSISYGTNFRAIGVTLPTTTVISKTLYIGGFWNSDDTKLDITAVAQEA